MRQLGILSLIVCLAAASGCNLCCWGKRNAELTGPTDIRKSQEWCLGEDAIFHQPMGPSRDNYGMKKTSWREWQPGGSSCANGSCGPVLTPVAQPHQPEMAPQLLPPQQGPPDEGGNPFRDDAEPLPLPVQSGAKQTKPQRVRMAATAKPSEFQSLFSQPTTYAPKTAAVAPKPKQPPALPPRVVTVPAPPSQPAQLVQQALPAPAQIQSGRMRITVSDAIDVAPVRNLAPIAAPGAVVQTAMPTPAEQQKSKAALASLEQMIDVAPTSSDKSGNGPAVIRNEFAAPAKPFRIATRDSLPEKNHDPELAKQTLSALGDMMSGDQATSTEE